MPEEKTESDTRRKVRKMDAAGLTPREISAALGISTQRVYQVLKDIEATEERAS